MKAISDCDKCDGTGTVQRDWGYGLRDYDCLDCSGTGELIDREAIERLEKLYDYLEQPGVLMSIPQPVRMMISRLLHEET